MARQLRANRGLRGDPMSHAAHRSARNVWPWTRTKDSGYAVSGTADRTEGGPAGEQQAPAGRSWPVDASPHDVATARRWLAEYADRFPPSIPPPPYPHPAIEPLLDLLVGGHNAAAILDAALRHCESFDPDLEA